MLRTPPVLVLGLSLCVMSCAQALAQSPTQPPPTPTVPVVAGHLKLTVAHTHGTPPFVLLGERLVLRGVVTPYVPGQTVAVHFYRDGRLVSSKTVRVLSLANGAGQFHLGYRSPKPGLLTVKATHAASPQMTVFSASAQRVRVAQTDLGIGATGPAVRLLQYELSTLHYAVPTGGIFEEATARAVIAYRKMTGLARVGNADSEVFRLLGREAGGFHVRYRSEGRHVEADLSRQVLAEIEPGGKVRRIYTISSGKPSTPTVLGRFRVYEKTPGTNSEGMVDSNYFIRGYAIHGYAEVPTYAASHGCLRVPIPDAPSIYAWVQIGTPVDVYYEGA